MTEQLEPLAELARRIDVIESGYEFLLAYAAQGRESDRGAGQGRSVREFLERMDQALEGLGALATAAADSAGEGLAAAGGPFFAAVDTDARVAQGAIRLLLAQSDIGSQLVDNLNASIHLRALLTDLFIIDEALKRKRASNA